MCGIGGRVPEKLGTLGDLGHTLNRASFNVSTAEAAKSCSRGAIAAFGPGEFHRVFGGGSKFMLPWAILLPLVMVHLAQREGSRMRPDWATSN